MAVRVEKKPSLGPCFQLAPLLGPAPLGSSRGTTTPGSTKSAPSPMSADAAPSLFRTYTSGILI
jgi:hypothetical protein